MTRTPDEAGTAARAGAEPIAIVGLACAFPESPDLRTFWQNILSGFDPVRDAPESRFTSALHVTDDRRAPDRTYNRRGAFLSDTRFDPLRYHIPPATVGQIEPLQLLALDVARRALEHAGYGDEADPRLPRDRAGVIFACSGIHDVGIGYAVRAMLPHFLQRAAGVDEDLIAELVRSVRETLPRWSEDSFPGFLPNVIAGRIANRLDLRGPNLVVDAACASSLAAVHLAVQQLRDRSCDVVVAGAADWSSNAFTFQSFAKTQALTPGPHARPFDAAADGLVLGEGVAAAVLKRLDDAERDGDRVIAVVRGVGGSSDGRNRSLTAPHSESQTLALARAYSNAGVDPATIELLEAHGTGTAVGDASEIRSVQRLFAEAGARPANCALGSIKSMIGHAKASAGFAGFVKAALAVQSGVLPPTLHVERPSPAIEEDGALYVNTASRPWVRDEPSQPRRAGVSAFGFGGTNFHVVLESHAASATAVDLTPRPVELLTWQCPTRAALRSALDQLHSDLGATPGTRLDEVAAAVHAGQRGGGVRAAIVARDTADLATKLRLSTTLLDALASDSTVTDPRGVYLSDAPAALPTAVAFLFPGQGAQRVGMLGDLMAYGPFGAGHLESADRVLADLLPRPLSDYIHPRPALDRATASAQQAALEDTRIAQPAVGAADMFASDVLAAFGLRPAMAAGHSYGEYVALWQAGVYSRDDLLRFSAVRGQAVAECAEDGAGGMVAIAADEETTRALIAEHDLDLTVANLNSPKQTILGGTTEAVAHALTALRDSGVAARRVPVSAAFHTPLVAAAAGSLAEQIRDLAMSTPTLPVYSNVTAEPYPADIPAVRALLDRHLVSPVRFAEQLQAMHRAGARVFIEAGPGRILTGLVRRTLADQPHVALALDSKGVPAWESLGRLLAGAFTVGLDVDLSPWFTARGLGQGPLSDYLARVAAEARGRPTDWWLSPAGSRPVTAKVARVHARPSAVSVRAPVKGDGAVSTPKPAANPDLVRRLDALLDESRRMQERQAQLVAGLQAIRAELGGAAPPAVVRAVPLATNPGSTRLAPPVPVLPPLPTLPGAAPPGGSLPPIPAIPVSASAASASSGRATAAGDGDTEVPSVATFQRELLAEVAERTGYPEEALELDLPLEAGLGIDSIKVMEVFSALGRYHRIMADDDMRDEEVLVRFAELQTLGAVIEHYAAQREKLLARRAALAELPPADVVPAAARAAESVGVPAAEPSIATEPPVAAEPPVATQPAIATEPPVDRLVVRAVSADLPETDDLGVDELHFPESQCLLLIGDVPVLAAATRVALTKGGVRTFHIVHGRGMKSRGRDRYAVDLSDPVAVAALAAALQDRGVGPVGGIVNLLGLEKRFRAPPSRRNKGGAAAALALGLALLNVMREFQRDLVRTAPDGGGLVVSVSSLGGRLGLAGTHPVSVAQAAGIGFLKGFARECPDVRVRLLDLDPDADPRVLLAALARESTASDPPLEVGFDADGRWRVQLVAEAMAEVAGDEPALDSDSVVLALGGGRGITAEVLKRLIEHAPVRLVIAGRTQLPTGPSGGGDANGPEVARNLKALEALGARVEYYVLDCRDEGGVASLVADVYKRHGRIDGAILGTGLVEDKRLKDKTSESFTRVFETKVSPAMTLARVLRPEGLKFLALFSSVSGRFGNVGQVDYCAANECLNKLAAHLDREWPGRVVALNWGPWDAGLVSEPLRVLYRKLGISLMSPAAGSAAFLAELRRGNVSAPEVVLACDANRLVRLMGGGGTL